VLTGPGGRLYWLVMTLVAQPDAGRRVCDKYELIEIAGEGGMAVVWRARMHGAAGFSRPVAVKKMKHALTHQRNHVAMFVEEARVGAELTHPNVVQVVDFVEDIDGTFCLVTEWVEGIDLSRFLRAYRARGERMSWAMAAAMGVGALRGLAAAHERSTTGGELSPVIHRDVSPQNILLGANGVVKLSDFGLARARDRMQSLTGPGIVKGKISYLAPEVARGKPATPLSDLFAMGSVLWEALAGRPLFDGVADREVFRKIHQGDVQPLGTERTGLPERLVRVIHRALAVEPHDRFVSARAMAQELASVLAGTLGDGRDAQSLLGRAVLEACKTAAPRAVAGTPAVGETVELGVSSVDIGPDRPR
jgi:eukaryotic-like serine/threonine-protein kinase